MGNLISRIFGDYFEKKDVRILMLGLDAAGKTTILFKLKLGEVVHTIPTIGFNVETVEFKKLKFNVWDVGGQDKIRPMWKHYYQNVQGLIFVVDCTDTERVSKAQEELRKMLEEEELKNACLLVFCNKSDMPGMAAKDMTEKLQLQNIKDRPWNCQSSSGLTGQGLPEGLNWLHDQLMKSK